MNFGNMGILKVTNHIGIIAEDNSDVEVIEEILKKYFEENTFAVKKFIG